MTQEEKKALINTAVISFIGFIVGAVGWAILRSLV